jgi:transcriptional regulator with XRE-family HTH domain
MPRTSTHPLLSARRSLRALGENIPLARLRRGFAASLVAERSGISRYTLRSIEKGEPTVAVGSNVTALFSLGLHRDLEQVAAGDELGRKPQDAGLEVGKRAPKRRRPEDGA